MAMCAVCKHQRRGEIEASIARGQTDREIGAAFGVSHGTVGRHRRLHVHILARSGARPRARAEAATGAPEGDGREIEQLAADLAEHVAEPEHDYRVASEISRALLAHVRTRARVERAQGPQRLDVITHPSFARLVGTLLDGLKAHAAARADLVAALDKLLGDAEAEYKPRTVSVTLNRLVAVLRREAADAPPGRARSSVSSALASALSAQERLSAAWIR